jgi:YD repeat-containing protein
VFSIEAIPLRGIFRATVLGIFVGVFGACDSTSNVQEQIDIEEPEPKYEAISADIDYEYDELNRLTVVRYSNGDVMRYSYDEAGNILSVEMDKAE